MAPTTTATTSKSRLVPTRPPSVISMSTADLRSRSATDTRFSYHSNSGINIGASVPMTRRSVASMLIDRYTSCTPGAED
ncbi:hypothetical protein AB1N83_008374 [Pleurotus pulmonarius]